MAEEFHLNGNGGAAVGGEDDQETINSAYKAIKDLKRNDGQLVTLTKQEMGLLHKLLQAATEEYREQAMWRMVDFLDDDEALNHVSAYYEASELGMDTKFNVAFMFALCSVSRKGARNNLMAQIFDTLSHQKYTANLPKEKSGNYVNPRSPIGS